MRSKLEIFLEHPVLPMDYRRCMLSLFKKALSTYENGRYYPFIYGNSEDKRFSFSVSLPKGAVFTGKTIHLPVNRISLTVSTADLQTGILLNNMLLSVRGCQHPLPDGNAMSIGCLSAMHEPQISAGQILVRFLSPLCVREHIEKQDRYFTTADPDFQEQLFRCAAYQLRNTEFSLHEPESLSFFPLQMKKTKVLHYNQYIPVSFGTCILRGEPRLLQHLYGSGIGSRRGSGFGLFHILSEGEVGCI